MEVDGRAIAAALYTELQEKLAGWTPPPHLTVFTCAPNYATRTYLSLKRMRAFELGLGFSVVELLPETSPEQAAASIEAAASRSDGIIVQLPFPEALPTEALIAAIPKSHDVDGFHTINGSDGVLSPVVGAIKEIADRHHVSFAGKQVVVVGAGCLVGRPSATWARAQGATVMVIDKDTPEPAAQLKQADIIITGVGKPGLVTSEMVKSGVVIFDAGTAEAGGYLAGDVDPSVATHASLYTPVPGGIGPVTVACLFANLIELAEQN